MEKPLRVVLNALYTVKAADVMRSDVTRYRVIAYLVIFRLRELGMKKCEVLIDSQDTAKMHIFLSFIFNESYVNEWIKESWCKFLDRNYVESTLLADLQFFRAAVSLWLENNFTKAFGHGAIAKQRKAQQVSLVANPSSNTTGSDDVIDLQAKSISSTSIIKKPPTVPIAPKLTQPKPRTAPEPERIPQKIQANPVPTWIENTSLDAIEMQNAEIRKQNHEKMQQKYNFDKTVPKLHETRNTINQLREEMEQQRQAAMAPLPKVRSPPPLAKTGANVRLNTAAILREDAVLSAKARKEAEIIEAYEGNLRDTTEYYAWREAELEKDEQVRLAHVAERRREAVEADAAAAKAKAAQESIIRTVVKDMKVVSKLVEEHKRIELAEEVAVKRRTADSVRTVEYINPAKARATIIADKKINHDALVEASKSAEVQIHAEREAEAKQRQEIIRQIRALERVPMVHAKTFDPVGTAGLGLFDEMGLIELRERLVLLKRRQQEEVEERRRNILRTKREHEELMVAKVKNIQRMRSHAADVNQGSRTERKTAEARSKQEMVTKREEAMLVLSEELAARRAAREEQRRIMEEEEARRMKAVMFAGAAATETEGRRLDSRLQAMERRVRDEQVVVLNARDQQRTVVEKEVRAAEVRAANAVARNAAVEAARIAAVEAAAREEQDFRLADISRKKSLFFEATDRAMAVQDLRDSLNEYGATRRHQDQENSRSRRGGIPIGVERIETLTRRVARLPEGHPLASTMSMRITQGTVALSNN